VVSNVQQKETIMVALEPYLRILPAVTESPDHNIWLSYDSEADVLYINFKKPNEADDAELTDDDVIVRYEHDAMIGYTVLHASKRAV
jgi:uncharacterized protein YuzE